MKIELHMIQNFAPSCLNRDETNAPKDCVFGGVRRARISSQCIKRSVRWEPGFQQAMAGHLASRSLRFPEQVREALVAMKVDDATAKAVAAELQKIAKKESEEGGEKKAKKAEEVAVFKTPQLIFYGGEEVQACAAAIKAMLDEKKSAKDILKAFTGKNAALVPVPRSVDIALFGRMVTSDAFANVDAACQVAHALSTHRTEMEFDYYTAVDDLQPKDDAGAGMIGTTGFNSACFYRYAVIDLAQLIENLGGEENRPLAMQAVDAFIRAAVRAVPSGKQNTFAAHNLPGLVLATVRRDGAWNLANAFEKPVAARKDKGLVEASVARLDEHYGRLSAAYGAGDVLAAPVLAVEGEGELRHLGQKVKSLDELVAVVMKTIGGGN